MANKKILTSIPGFILCIAIMFLGILGAELVGVIFIQLGILTEGSSSPISGIFVAILLGIIIRNTVGVKDYFLNGIQFSIKQILRLGIIFLGLRLSLMEALKLGAFGIPLIILCIGSGLFITLYLTKKLRQSNRLGTLIACGTGICGITAIMATSPVIKAKEDEISYAVANITVFGLTGMLFYPILAHYFFAFDPVKAGMFLGTAVHDTAQVTGAALIYDQMFDTKEVIDAATVTKLTRNLFIIAIIPLVSYLYYRSKEVEEESEASLPKWYTFIPLFVIGFLIFSLLRTIGDYTLLESGKAYGFLTDIQWSSIYTNISNLGSKYLLGIAMAGVGLSTNFKMFKGIGLKPFYIGFIAALSVGLVSFILIFLFGNYIVI